MHHNLKEKHFCTLPVTSHTALPKLHPHAPTWKRVVRELRKLILISTKNPRTKLRFRSEESVFVEAKRHLKESKISIHPFSIVAMYRDIVMHCTWVLYFYIGTLYLTFLKQSRIDIMRYVLYSLKPILGAHLVLSFFIGFYDSKHDYIEVRMKKIIKNYLVGYFIFDLFFFVCPEMGYTNPVLYTFEVCFHLLIFIRIFTINKYFRIITLMLDLGDSFHDLLCLIVTSFMLIHFFSIFIYSTANIQYKFGVLTNTSWVVVADIAPFSQKSGWRKYLICAHKISAMFLGTCSGMWNARNVDEMLTFTIVILTGMFYMAYVIALVLQMSLSIRSSGNLYNQMLYQIVCYSRVNKLPSNLKKRMRMFYANRFKEKFFREDLILNSLSDHLRLELKLHSCRQLLRSTWLFQSLTTMIVGELLVQLKPLVVLPNDVIKTEDDTDNIYFITSGEVAVLTQDGTEIMHVSDGDYFGEFSVLSNLGLFEANQINKNLRFVAVYFSELLVLHQEAFRFYLMKSAETVERIKQVAKIKDSMNLERLERIKRSTHVVISRKVLTRSVKRRDTHFDYNAMAFN